jgi:predicted phage gp36 major capsid-like protein
VAEADDRAAALAALQLGAAKWGGKVTIYGSPEYQAMCVQLAVENGIEIVNPELREQFQAAKEAHRRAREEAMRTHQAQQFARYHEAVQADRYTLTCIKMTPTSGWPGSSAPVKGWRRRTCTGAWAR